MGRGAALGALAAGGTLASMGSSGGVSFCAPTDTTLYCRLSRGVGIVQMIIMLMVIFIAVMAFIYFAFSWMTSKSKTR